MTTPRAQLPEIATSQASKEITHNEALRKLEALVIGEIVSRTTTAQPGSPADGAVYVVPTGATGGWSAQVDSVAHFTNGSWRYYPPQTGWRLFVADEQITIRWDGSDWAAEGIAPPNPQTGTTYTLGLADAISGVTLANAGAITLTVPPNSSVPFAVGTRILLAQTGAGAVTIAPDSGVTINSLAGADEIVGQYGAATLWQVAVDEWVLFGDLVA